MIIARIENGSIVEYPLHPGHIRDRFAPTTFPAVMTAASLPDGYIEVQPTPIPEHHRWQEVVEAVPVCTEGEWFQRWLAQENIMTLTERKADLTRVVVQLASQKRNSLYRDLSPFEAASWPLKHAEAIAHQKGHKTVTMLSMEAKTRGISVVELAGKVLSKAAQFSRTEAAIAGRCGALKDAIKAARDTEALVAININSGWPETTKGE